MKVSKVAIVITAAMALVTTFAFAAKFNATISGRTFSSDGSKIQVGRFNNKSLVTDCTSGTQVLYDNSDTATNLVYVADSCGNLMCTNILLLLDQATCTSNAVSSSGNLKEQVCTVPFELPNGGRGTLIIDMKTIVTKTGPNLTAKASGVFTNSIGEPGSVTMSINGAFKRPKNCH